MTTPRDDIAGLNERLREDIAQLVTAISQAKFSGPRTGIRVKDPSALMDDLTDAAAQLDSLLKERDALGERVKELDARYLGAVAARGMLRDRADEAESRALRAEQERDTLARVMEDTATELGCEPNNETILETILRLQQERDEAYERLKPLAQLFYLIDDLNTSSDDTVFFQHDGTIINFGQIRAARELVRRLAGPEKGKKE